jgi:hypothetical protein
MSWDHSLFSMSPEELEIEEAIRAMERLLGSSILKRSTCVSLKLALDALRADRD